MAKLTENDRITGPFIATAGQTDFPADFPMLKAFGVRVRRQPVGSAPEVLSVDAGVSIVTEAADGFTCRLDAPCTAGERVWIWSELPAERDRAHTPNGAIRTPTLEGDAMEAQAQIQELKRDLAQTIRSPLGEPAPDPLDILAAVEIVATKEDRLGGVLRSRVRAAPGIDDTARLQADLDAGYRKVVLPAGTIWVRQLDIPHGVDLVGQGEKTIIKRLPNATRPIFIAVAGGAHGFRHESFVIDGNKANCVTPATDMVVQGGCWDFKLSNIRAVEALAVGGSYGGAITVLDTADAVHSTWSAMEECVADNCDTFGLSGYRVKNFTFLRCRGTRNKNNAGINVDDFNLPVAAVPTNENISIVECHLEGNGAGIAMFGFRERQTALGDVASQNHFRTKGVRIINNTCIDNRLHGVEIQAEDAIASGNILRRNGSDTSNGNALFNCLRSKFVNNVLDQGWYYGVDGGGSRECQFTGNTITGCGTLDLGDGPANQCAAMNLGATILCAANDNTFASNGGTGAGGGAYNILASRYDGSHGANWMRWSGRDLTIKSNRFTATHSSHVSIRLNNGFQSGVEVADNTTFCDGATPVLPYDLSADGAGFTQRNNRVKAQNGSFAIELASAPTLVLPDHGEVFGVLGTATVSNVKSRAQIYWKDKVRWVGMDDGGFGYTSPPAVVFAGGDGVDVVGVACLGADGVIYGIYIIDPGEGFTSAPAVSLVGGGGVGASATAYIGCDNTYDRNVELKLRGASSFTTGGNLFVPTTRTGSAFGISTLSLRGEFGNMLETSWAA